MTTSTEPPHPTAGCAHGHHAASASLAQALYGPGQREPVTLLALAEDLDPKHNAGCRDAPTLVVSV
jgi:hypothetical protein